MLITDAFLCGGGAMPALLLGVLPLAALRPFGIVSIPGLCVPSCTGHTKGLQFGFLDSQLELGSCRKHEAM